MASEFIFDLRRPGFPKFDNSEGSFRTSIEYVGNFDDLFREAPNVGESWGDYQGTVATSRLEPIEGTNYAILTVDCEAKFEPGDGTGYDEGVEQETKWEVDWVMFTRSWYEHPEFRVGGAGTYALTEMDVYEIGMWETEEDVFLKEQYSFRPPLGGETQTLSNNAKMFVQSILLGIPEWEDFSPVARKTTTYSRGNPGQSSAGQKEDPEDFTGRPTGYEWRKTADRAVQAAGGGTTKWDRVEEWTGAKKVLYDRDEVFWSPPEA